MGNQDWKRRLKTKTKYGEQKIRNDKDGEKERKKFSRFPLLDKVKPRLPSIVCPVSKTPEISFKKCYAFFSLGVATGSKGGLWTILGALWAVKDTVWAITASMWAFAGAM